MTPDEIADGLLSRRLPHREWTHRGHLTAGAVLIGRLGEAGALDCLRRAIPAYNESVGTPNTDAEGYHDTITVYFVWALARLLEGGFALEQILVDPLVALDAPLRYWPADVLFSAQARRGWLPPACDGPDVPRLPQGCPEAP